VNRTAHSATLRVAYVAPLPELHFRPRRVQFPGRRAHPGRAASPFRATAGSVSGTASRLSAAAGSVSGAASRFPAAASRLPAAAGLLAGGGEFTFGRGGSISRDGEFTCAAGGLCPDDGGSACGDGGANAGSGGFTYRAGYMPRRSEASASLAVVPGRVGIGVRRCGQARLASPRSSPNPLGRPWPGARQVADRAAARDLAEDAVRRVDAELAAATEPVAAERLRRKRAVIQQALDRLSEASP
jgi:hypothetical protein